MRPGVVADTFRNYSPDALDGSMLHHAELVIAAGAKDGEWAEAIIRAPRARRPHRLGSHRVKR
ncbi:hypothetical protein AHiyo4_45480 [Arthrobacter sp. Hiyo4]|nr:hypothetical protein AHiyo4_45480 [Arthrobacter sp. Hiyo4]